MKESIQVAEYGLVSFCQAIKKAIDEGYDFDFEVNEGVPQNFGGFLEVKLFKNEVIAKESVEPSEAVVATQVSTEAEQSSQEPADALPDDSDSSTDGNTDDTPEVQKGKTVRSGRKARQET